MKKLFRLAIILSLFLAVPYPVALAQSTTLGDKWALIVGVSKFQDPSMDLKYPSKDAKDFANFLIQKANFAPDHVKLLTDNQATQRRILTEIGDTWLPKVAKPADLVIIYISSHGSPSQLDNEGMNYLVAHDTSRDALFASGISLQQLSSIIVSRVHSKRIVVILDACHSGSVKTNSDGKGITRSGNFDIGQIPMGEGLMMICSSSPSQVSWESKKYDNGVFTKKLMDALSVRGQYTKMGEAFAALKTGVQTEVLEDRGELQEPVIRSAWKGDDLVIASKPVSPSTPSEHLKGNGGIPGSGASVVSAPVISMMPQPAAESRQSPTVNELMNSSAMNMVLLDRISVLPVVGPTRVKMDAIWQGFAQKDNLDVSKRLNELGLDKKIEAAFQSEIKHHLRNKDVVTMENSPLLANNPQGMEGKIDAKALLKQPEAVNWKLLGRLAQSKFLLQIEVLEVELQDNAMGDIADMRISARLVNGDSGETVWMLKSKKFSRLTQATHDDSIFSEITNYFPRAAAKELAKTIVNAIKEQ